MAVESTPAASPFHVPAKISGVPRVVIIGGGFAGLAAARELADSNADVVLIDRRNHHVFQPLLYQVATAALSPADIAAPIRQALRHVKNCHVVLAEPTAIDLAARTVMVGSLAIGYDYLILAAGATHSYFGHDDWEANAPGLKTLEDATEIRRRILLAFEFAEYAANEAERRAALTFAIVGGGPTGVELAGAIKEIAAQSIPADFRNIDTKSTRVILFEGGPRLLPAMDVVSSARAQKDLEGMGVEVRCNAQVTQVQPHSVQVGDEVLNVRTIFWAAGVRASSLGATLGVPLDRAGRVIVEPDLSIKGHPEVFVTGDMASAKSADTGAQVPGVAQGALQTGHHAGKLIAAMIRNPAASRAAFSYNDKGTMATIGRSRAVAEIKGFKFGGYFAWLLWSLIHISALITFRNKIAVFVNWVWSWFFFSRDARLILGGAKSRQKQM
jgi:NADH dehydrogenase